MSHAFQKEGVHEHTNTHIHTHTFFDGHSSHVQENEVSSSPSRSGSVSPRGRRSAAVELKQPNNSFGWCSTALWRASYSKICIFIPYHNFFLTTLRCYSALWWWSTERFMVNRVSYANGGESHKLGL